MPVEFKTDKLNPCICGFKPDHYTMYYGSTPYDIYCPNCKKQTTMAKCKITGYDGHLIDYWNRHISKLTLEQLEEEVKDLYIERKENDPFNEYKSYEYYWEEGSGEKFYGKC